MVFLHTLIGLIFLVPYTYYQLRHWGIYRTIQLSQFKLLGYMAMITVIVASVSGVILAYQAIALTKINALMDTIHLVSTFAFIAFTILISCSSLHAIIKHANRHLWKLYCRQANNLV